MVLFFLAWCEQLYTTSWWSSYALSPSLVHLRAPFPASMHECPLLHVLLRSAMVRPWCGACGLYGSDAWLLLIGKSALAAAPPATYIRGILARLRPLPRLICPSLTITTGAPFGIASHSPAALSLLFVIAHPLYPLYIGESICTFMYPVPRCSSPSASLYGFCMQAPGLYPLANWPWRPASFGVQCFFSCDISFNP